MRQKCKTSQEFFANICLEVFFKDGQFPASFSLFSSFLFYNWLIKFCRCLDLNCRSLVSDATLLPTEPQPLPYLSLGGFFKCQVEHGRKHLKLSLVVVVVVVVVVVEVVSNKCMSLFEKFLQTFFLDSIF